MPIVIDIEPEMSELAPVPKGRFQWIGYLVPAMVLAISSATFVWIGLSSFDAAINREPAHTDAKADKLPIFKTLAPEFLSIGFAPPPSNALPFARVPVWPIQQLCSDLQTGSGELASLWVMPFDVRPDRCLLDITLLDPSARDQDPEAVIGTIFLHYRGDRFLGGRNLRMKLNLTKQDMASQAYRRSLQLLRKIAENAGFDLHDDMITFFDRGRSFRLSRAGMDVDFLKERFSNGRYNLILSFKRWENGPAACRFNVDEVEPSLPVNDVITATPVADDQARNLEGTIGLESDHSVESFLCHVSAGDS